MMKYIAVALAVCLCLAAVTGSSVESESGCSDSGSDSGSEGTGTTTCICPFVFDPVCGDDGIQYNSVCDRNCAGAGPAGDEVCGLTNGPSFGGK